MCFLIDLDCHMHLSSAACYLLWKSMQKPHHWCCEWHWQTGKPNSFHQLSCFQNCMITVISKKVQYALCSFCNKEGNLVKSIKLAANRQFSFRFSQKVKELPCPSCSWSTPKSSVTFSQLRRLLCCDTSIVKRNVFSREKTVWSMLFPEKGPRESAWARNEHTDF